MRRYLVTWHGGKRLVNTTTGPREVGTRGMRADACPVQQGACPFFRGRAQTTVNGGRNLDDPKVAKFLGH